MTNPIHQLADVIRNVTVVMQRAIEDGHRLPAIDANDLIEVFLAIADRLDPPVRNEKVSKFACPECREHRTDRLIAETDDLVRCGSCGITFEIPAR